MQKVNDKYVLNEKDEKILYMLSDNGRTQWKEMGDALGVSANAARMRVLRLVRSGVIKRFTIDIDYDKILETN